MEEDCKRRAIAERLVLESQEAATRDWLGSVERGLREIREANTIVQHSILETHDAHWAERRATAAPSAKQLFWFNRHARECEEQKSVLLDEIADQEALLAEHRAGGCAQAHAAIQCLRDRTLRTRQIPAEEIRVRRHGEELRRVSRHRL